MNRVGSILHGVIRRGGLVALAPSILVILGSRYYGLMFLPTRFEYVGVIGGECGMVWRVVVNPPPQGASDGRAFIINKTEFPCWISNFSWYVNPATQQRVLWFPLWVPMAVSALWAGIGLAVPKRPRAGSCGGCGYDRSGLSAASPCPECGRAMPATAAPRGGSS